MAQGLSTVFARSTVGLLLVVGAVLKVAGYGTPEYQDTLAWAFSGGNAIVLAAVAAAEAFLGTCLLLRIAQRAACVTILVMLGAFSLLVGGHYLLSANPAVGVKPCGCLGAERLLSSGSGVRMHLALNAALALALAATLPWKTAPRTGLGRAGA